MLNLTPLTLFLFTLGFALEGDILGRETSFLVSFKEI